MLKLIIILAVPICFFEGMPLIRTKKWKELIVLGVLIGIALLIAIGKALDLPTPTQLLDQWLRPVGKAIFKRF